MRPRSSVLLAVLVAACAPGADPCDDPGVICTWAGTGEPAFDGDGLPPRGTSFYWPVDLDFAPDGRAYLLDWQNHRVRRTGADGRIETVIGNDLLGDGPPDQGDRRPEGAPGTEVQLNHPTDVAFLPDGTLLLAAWHNHKVRRLDTRTGRVHVICGSGPGSTGDDGVASRALLNQPKSVVVDGQGAVYIADGRNQRIRRLDAPEPDARIVTVAGVGRAGFGGDGGGPLQAVFHLQEQNENPEPGGGIAVDDRGRLYVADTYNNRIRRVDLRAGTVETVAGTGARGYGGDGGPATAAILNRPRDLEVGPDGRLYLADTDNHRIRAVDLDTGIIETVAGDGRGGFSGDGGAATRASLHRPFGIAFDGAGRLHVADTFNNRFRRVAR